MCGRAKRGAKLPTKRLSVSAFKTVCHDWLIEVKATRHFEASSVTYGPCLALCIQGGGCRCSGLCTAVFEPHLAAISRPLTWA
jgi:hypothetical protein